MDWPQWISALSALGALVAGSVAAVVAKRLYDVERGRDRDLAQERRRERPSRVSAWVVTYVTENERTDGLVLSNQAGTPIYDVRIESTDKLGSDEPLLKLDVAPPGQFFVGRDRRSNFHWSFPESVDQLVGLLQPVMKKPEWGVQALRFTDASGVRWLRDRRGILTDEAG